MTTLLALLGGVASAASYDPALHWQSLTTDHFVITYHDGEEQLAREMAVDAENAWDKLTLEFHLSPRHRIDVVLVDSSDSANGYASITPANHIVMFATAPEGDSTLGFYRDWNEAIITHELTHILHLSTVEGAPRLARVLFGTYITTHQLEPRWIVEGLATYEETRHTTGGRGRSPEVDMVKRTAVLAGEFPPLGNLDGFQALPPGGNLRYLFGQDFIAFIADRAGAEVWPEWVHQYGRSIPFFFHFRHSFGNRAGDTNRKDDDSFVEVYREWKAALETRYAAQADDVKARGVTSFRVISPDDNGCGMPAWTDDGTQIAYSCSDPRRGPSIWVADGEGNDARVLVKHKAAPTVEWRSDGQALAYTMSHTVDLYKSYNDVYLYDLKKKSSRSLTSEQRARDPDFSPDGSKMLVVTNDVQNNQLATLTVDGRLTPLTDRKDHTQFGTPRYSPDGRHVAVSVWQDGRRDLWIYTAAGEPYRRITWDEAIDREPAWSADGRWLYFTSNRSGIPNIYAVDRGTEHLYQVTNVLTGASMAAPRSDGKVLAFAAYAMGGDQIALMDVKPETWWDLGPLPAWEGVAAPIAARLDAPLPTAAVSAAPAAPEAAASPTPAEPTPVASTLSASASTASPPAASPPAASPPMDPPPAASPPAESTPADSPTVDEAPAPPAVPPPASAPFFPPSTDPPQLARRDDLVATPYSPLRTLFPPRMWFPSAYLTSTGDSFGVLGAASTYGTDLLNQYSYSGYLTYRTDARFLGGGASLVVNKWKPVFGLSFSDMVTPYGDVYRQLPPPAEGGAYVPSVETTRTRYWDHRLRAAVSMRYPLSPYAGVTAYYSGTLRVPLDALGADTWYPYLPTRGLFNSFGVGWGRSKGEAYSLSISPERARSLGVGVEITPSFLGSFTFDDANQRVPFNQMQATAEWREYRPVPWLANHVLAWKLSGGGTAGNGFRYGSFRLGGSFSENGITVVPSEWRMLRGYYPASDSGEWYWLGSGEYRFPIWNLDRGVGTIPLFARFLSGAVFVDAGNAFDEQAGAGIDQTLLGVGAEVQAYLLYFYGAGIYARAGYGFAPRGDGIPFGDVRGLYLALGSSF